MPLTIIFRHEDNARPHIHIVSLRIDEQGRKIRDYKEWERSMKICRELEQKYGLVPSTKEERKASGAMTAVEYRKGDLKHQIANVVRPALQDYRFRSFREFKALLGLFNVTVEEVRRVSTEGHATGWSMRHSMRRADAVAWASSPATSAGASVTRP